MTARPNKSRRALSAALLSFLLASGTGMTADQADLSEDPRVTDAVSLWTEWIRYQAATSRVPAISFGIVHDQTLVASGAFGEANPAEGIDADTDTLYSICSISKLFTSIALMQQYEAGKVRLDDPVGQHLDWFDIKDIHPDDEPITIRRLLTHSSGLPRESDFPYWTAADYPFPTRDELKQKLGEQQTLYPASRYFQYSNLGLTLVGEIVAAAAENSYADYMREALLGPLGMDDTSTDIPLEKRGDQLAIGHTALQRTGTREVVEPFQARAIAPAAGFASNVNDLAKFAMWQFRVLSDKDSDLLKASSLREMQRVHWIDPDWETTWGLGFSVRQEGDRTYARHGGGCPGYYTEFRLEPKTKMAAIVLSNAIGTETGHYAGQAIELIEPAIAKAMDAPEGTPERDGSLARYTGVYKTIWGQSAVVPWEDGLAMLDLGSSSPAEDMMRLQHVEDDTFRRVRDDDSLGETVRFELGEDGRAERVWRHSGWAQRLEN